MAPILVVATNRGITKIRGTNYRVCFQHGTTWERHAVYGPCLICDALTRQPGNSGAAGRVTKRSTWQCKIYPQHNSSGEPG